MKSVGALTPKCKKLYKKCIQIVKSKKRLLNSFEERLEKAKELSEQNSFDALIENMSPRAMAFLSMQVTQCNKVPKRRRFTAEQKLLSVTLQKQSPKGYKMLQKIFILPSKRTLSKFMRNVLVTPGLNANVMAHLKATVQKWDDKQKLCSIMFDEVALTPHLTFVEAEDQIEGFINFGDGEERVQKLCDHALVFMIRGLCTSWTQPIAHYFCEGTTPAIKLKNIIKVNQFFLGLLVRN